jgi:hypothetical protein
MVLEPDALAIKRDPEGRPIPHRPRLTSASAASGTANHGGSGQKEKRLTVVSLAGSPKFQWMAILTGCFAVIWMTANSLRESTPAQPRESQAGALPPAPPAAQPSARIAETRNWFYEDLNSQKNATGFDSE